VEYSQWPSVQMADLAGGENDGIKLWDVSTGQCLKTLQEHRWSAISGL